MFSSLSESSFLPTKFTGFRPATGRVPGSHLFQRVVSFRPIVRTVFGDVQGLTFSSLSESSFLPTKDGNGIPLRCGN